jgi:hypothetical protein
MPVRSKVHVRDLTAKDREFDNVLHRAAQRWQRSVTDSAARRPVPRDTRAGQPGLWDACVARVQ